MQGEKGGGLFMDQCSTSVLNCTFTSNTASLLGGGLYRSYPRQRSDIRGCNFSKNSAAQYGGALYEQNIDVGSIEVQISRFCFLSSVEVTVCCRKQCSCFHDNSSAEVARMSQDSEARQLRL